MVYKKSLQIPHCILTPPQQITISTPPNTNMSPQKRDHFKKEISLPTNIFEGIGDMLVGPGTTEPVFGVALSGMPWDEPGIQESSHLDEFYRFWNTVFPRKKAV